MKKVLSVKRKIASKITLPVLIEQDENGIYVATVPSIRSCYTQGRTLEELYRNLDEVVELSREMERGLFGVSSHVNRIVGFQNIEFKA